MADLATLVRRIGRTEAQLAIRQLASRYCMAIDDRDPDTLAGLFTPDGCFRDQAGLVNAEGRDGIRAHFERRYRQMGPSNHWTHDHIIDVAEDGVHATGIVFSHLESVIDGVCLIGSGRYHDDYARGEDGAWRFASRTLALLYFAPAKDYPHILGERSRVRAAGREAPGDYPESLPGWALHPPQPAP